MPGAIYHPSPNETCRIAGLTSTYIENIKGKLNFYQSVVPIFNPWVMCGQTNYSRLREMGLENGSFIGIDGG